MSTPEPGLASNATSLLLGRMAVAVFGWAGTVLIVRSLTEDEFGRFAFVFSVLGMLSIITDMGMGRVAISGVLDDADDPATFAGTYIILRALLGGVGYVVAIGFVVAAGYSSTVVQATAVGGVVTLLSTPSSAYDVAFQARLRMRQVAIAGVVGRAAQLALIAAVATAGGSLVWFMVPAVVGELVILAMKLRQAHGLIPFRYVVRPGIWASLAREAVPLSIGGALVTLYNQLDTVMLSKLDTFTSVGLYGVSYKFADLARFVATAVTVPILTLLVRSWPDDPAAFRETLRRGVGFLAFFSGLLIVEFGLFSEQVVAMLYGESYREAGHATRLLIIATVMGLFTRLAFSSLIAAARHRTYPFVALVGLMANIALNVMLIPRWSFNGAAVGTVLTEVLVMTLAWIHVSKLPGVRPFRFGFAARTLGAVAAGVGIGLGVGTVTSWEVAAVSAALVYASVAHLLRSPGPLGLASLVRDQGAP